MTRHRARNPSLMDVIAERTLDFKETGASHSRPVRLVLGRPELEGERWSAPYGLYDPGAEVAVWEARAYGADSLQAVFMALHILPSIIEARFGRGRGRLTIDGEAWDLGLGKVILPSPSGVELPEVDTDPKL